MTNPHTLQEILTRRHPESTITVTGVPNRDSYSFGLHSDNPDASPVFADVSGQDLEMIPQETLPSLVEKRWELAGRLRDAAARAISGGPTEFVAPQVGVSTLRRELAEALQLLQIRADHAGRLADELKACQVRLASALAELAERP